MTTEYKELDINLLDEHPDNPRIIYRDDVINSVAHEIKLNGKEVLANDNALSVAPRNGRYIIYKGHHRFRGAKKENLDTIYCWSNNDITDEEMYIELLLDNNQAELLPLERGKHAYAHTKKYKRKEDEDKTSIKKYSERIGEERSTVINNKNAYEVYNYCKKRATRVALLDLSARHYLHIHSLEKKEWWPLIAEKAIDSEWPSRDLEKQVKNIKNIQKELEEFWISMDDLVKDFLDLKNPDSRWIKYKTDLITYANNKLDSFEKEIKYKDKDNKIKVYKPKKDFLDKLKDKKVDNKKDIDEIYSNILTLQTERKKLEIQALESLEERITEWQKNWNNTKIKIHNIDILKYETDNKFDTIIADFPYYISQDTTFTREKTADVSLNFGKWDQFKNRDDYFDNCKKWIKKFDSLTKKDASVYIFCSWYYISHIRDFINEMENWNVSNIIVWHKTNPTPSFRETTYLHTLEFCIYSKKGKPTFNFKDQTDRMHNFYESGLVSGEERIRDEQGEKIHSAQKPVDLISQFLDDSLISKGRVLDAFAGTGSTSIAAYNNNYDWESVEINEEYCKEIEKRLYTEWLERNPEPKIDVDNVKDDEDEFWK